VNDRGPFVPGRIVDVSHSAAAALGMIDHGTAEVKVDIVQ
jgi:rare lipoprotein A